MKILRSPVLMLSIAFFAVIGISLWVRDGFFVGALSVLVTAVAGCASLFALLAKNGPLQKPGIACAVVATVFIAAIGASNAPLKIAFTVLEPSFDAYAKQLASGDRLSFPFWIGPFRVIDGGVRSGSGAPYLMTSGHSGEIDGFVQDSAAAYFNVWSITPLGVRWAYVQED